MKLTNKEILALNELLHSLDYMNEELESVLEKTNDIVDKMNYRTHNTLYMLGEFDTIEEVNEVLESDELKEFGLLDKINYGDFSIIRFDYQTFITNMKLFEKPYTSYIAVEIADYYKDNVYMDEDEDIFCTVEYTEKDDNTVWFNFSNRAYTNIEGEVIELRGILNSY